MLAHRARDFLAIDYTYTKGLLIDESVMRKDDLLTEFDRAFECAPKRRVEPRSDNFHPTRESNVIARVPNKVDKTILAAPIELSYHQGSKNFSQQDQHRGTFLVTATPDDPSGIDRLSPDPTSVNNG